KDSADAVTTARYRVGLCMDEQGIPDLIPREDNLILLGYDFLRPGIARIPRFGEPGVNHRYRRACDLGIEHSLDSGLQPPRHRSIVRIDAPTIFRQLALEIENVPHSGRAENDAPEACIRLVGVAIVLAKANERVLPRHDHAIGICNAHYLV